MVQNPLMKILHLLSFNNKPITKGQIVYYLQFKPSDFYQIEDAVNIMKLLQINGAFVIYQDG